MKKTKSKKKIILNILMVLCLFTAIGSGGYLAYYYYQSSRSEQLVEDLRQMIVKVEPAEPSEIPEEQPEDAAYTEIDGVKVLKKFEKLYRQNRDFVGWVCVDDTNIDYPVMYTPNDDELGQHYIHRNFEGDYAAAGTPFLDANCSLLPATDNVIVYGHNMNSGKMFHDLLLYEKEDFYNTHKTFTFDTIYGEGVYEVVAVIRSQIMPEDYTGFKYYEFVNAGSEQEFDEYVGNLTAMSVIDTGVKVSYGDKLVTLSTCAYHAEEGRFAVIGKKIK